MPVDQERGPFEEQVQVAGWSSGHLLDARQGADGIRQFLRDDARCLAERPGELKGDGYRQVAEGPAGRRLDGERRHLGKGVFPANCVADCGLNLLMNRKNHGR